MVDFVLMPVFLLYLHAGEMIYRLRCLCCLQQQRREYMPRKAKEIICHVQGNEEGCLCRILSPHAIF